MQQEKIVVEVDSDMEYLMPLFMTSRQKDLEGLAKGLEGGDFSALRSIGHDMKGTGSSFGFDAVSHMGNLIEIAALAQDLETIRSQFLVFQNYMARVEIKYIPN